MQIKASYVWVPNHWMQNRVKAQFLQGRWTLQRPEPRTFRGSGATDVTRLQSSVQHLAASKACSWCGVSFHRP